MNAWRQVAQLGQSVWFDNINRALLVQGELKRMIDEDGLSGLTSNPTIFEKAIAGSGDYDEALRRCLTQAGGAASPRDLFYALAIEDISAAADAFRPTYDATEGHDGYVSLEVSPDLAHDSAGTVREARALWQRVKRDNLMIKVPGTVAGVTAFQALVEDGINVNVTLLFGVERYKQVLEAYLRGLEARVARGLPIAQIASVASFFVSRVDAAVDRLLEDRRRSSVAADVARVETLLGGIAIANAKLAYAHYKEVGSQGRYKELTARGARSQRLLWASTGMKNPQYSDVLYIEALIGAETVTTVPPATYKAFKDHGKARPTLTQDVERARRDVAALQQWQVDLERITEELERDGVKSFADSFNKLLSAIDKKAQELRAMASETA